MMMDLAALFRRRRKLWRYRRVLRWWRYPLGVIGLGIWLASPLPAQWPTTVGEDLLVGVGQQYTALAPDGAGGAYVLWPGPDSSLYGTTLLQHVDAWGIRQWNPPISVGGTGDTQSATRAIVADGQGGVYVAFIDLTYIVPPHQYAMQLRLQHIDATGQLRWGDGVVIAEEDTQRYGWNLDLVPDDRGGMILAWTDRLRDSTEPPGFVLTLQRYGPDGTARWDSGGVAVSPELPENGRAFAMIRDGAGGAILRWTPASARTALARITAPGTVAWTRATPADTYFGQMIADGAQGAFLLGSHQDPSDSTGATYLPMVQRINGAGAFIWDGSQEMPGYASRQLLARTTDHGILIYRWNESPPATLHRFGPAGTRLSPPGGWQITGDSLDIPQALLPSWGQTFLAFYSRRVSTGNRDLYARRINYQGEPVWAPPEQPVSHLPNIHAITSDGRGGAILALFNWVNLSLKQISVHGNLGEVVTGLSPAPAPGLPATPTLEPNYPNPFNGQTMLTYTLPRRSPVRLTIVDLRGRVVRTLVAAPQGAGEHTRAWNGTDQSGHAVASGVYFVRLQTPDHTRTRKVVVVR